MKSLQEINDVPREIITTDRIAPSVGPFSAAVRAGDLLFLSGQIALDSATGKLVAGDIGAQTEQVFANISAVLDAAGKSFDDVVKTTIYLADIKDFGAMNAVYARHFQTPYPARTTIQAAGLPLGAAVELEVVARYPQETTEERHIMMKLYSADLSPYAARVRMQLYAKGITDFVLELPEDWGMPKFRERFPIGRLPVLDIDGDLIPESEVIAEYLEETHPQPPLLGRTPRETAHIRTLARIGDIYIMNNVFALSRQTGALSRQTPATARDNGVGDQLATEVVRNLKALDRLIGTDGFACSGRITLADCALVPGLFFAQVVLPAAGLDSPIPARANVAAYWAAIQKNEHAARVLVELRRGLEERREMIRSGAFERFRAAATAAQKEADARQ